MTHRMIDWAIIPLVRIVIIGPQAPVECLLLLRLACGLPKVVVESSDGVCDEKELPVVQDRIGHSEINLFPLVTIGISFLFRFILPRLRSVLNIVMRERIRDLERIADLSTVPSVLHMVVVVPRSIV